MRISWRDFGFGLQWAWICLSLHSSVLYANASDPLQDVGLASFAQPCVSVVSLLALALLFRRGRIGESRVACGIAAAGGALGTVAVFAGSTVGSAAGLALFLAGVALSTVANSIVFIMWSERYSEYPTQEAMRYVSLSIALGVGLAMALGALPLPHVAALAVAAALPCLSLAALPRKRAEGEGPEAGAPTTAGSPADAPPTIGKRGCPLPLTFMAGLVIYGAVFGLMSGLFFSDADGFLDTSGVGLAFTGATALAFALGSFAFPKRLRFETLAKMVLPLLAAGFILLPVGNDSLAYGLMKAGETMFDMVLWIVMLDIAAASTRYSAAAVFSWGRLIVQAGRAVGFVLVSTIAAAFSVDGMFLAAVALVVVYVLILASSFAFDGSFFRVRKGGLSRGALKADARARCASMRQRYGLSPREMDVLELIAQGRSGPVIAKQLVIAESTVKTHTHNIYRKVGVATRQELLDVVDGADVSDENPNA
ncbi:helix-turn-helix transcriptional regulator [Eggerthella guodeyinii]|uniref:Helix-turn-helix transcriptional regulator n=1 Tax=Eggerthella guodeyinii TaxID=2690837 RepID=A0A6L7IQB2_9ACTN|nr:helix-turn-helix transcriptional regulator [Eggerthella guodeyinii]QOS69746.1 helix-turn-helix transcriptional regulator [Eggerthella guodeyinii]